MTSTPFDQLPLPAQQLHRFICQCALRSEEERYSTRISSKVLRKLFGRDYRRDMERLITSEFLEEDLGSEVRGVFTRRYTVLVPAPRCHSQLSRGTKAPKIPSSFTDAALVNRTFTEKLSHPDALVDMALGEDRITVADNRLFTPLNGMKKEYRAGLVHAGTGEKTVELDTANANPAYLLTALKSFPAYTIPEIDGNNWVGLTSSGTLHGTMAELVGTSVEVSKSVFNKIVNCKGRLTWDRVQWDENRYCLTELGKQESKTYRAYQLAFPKLMKLLGQIRKDCPGALHSALTQIERKIIRRKLPRKALKCGITFADLHDGIQCLESDAPMLKQLLQECSEEVLGQGVTVRVKVCRPVVVSVCSLPLSGAEAVHFLQRFRLRRIFKQLFPPERLTA